MDLTNIQCKNAATRSKAYKLSDSDGLFLLVHPNGSKYWRLKYRIAGKEKLLSIGVYPDISLQAARSQRDDARKLIAQGTDPSQAKKRKKQLATININNSFESVAREWHANNKEPWSTRYAVYVMNRLENDIFPTLGKRPIAEIDSLELLDTVKRIEKRGAYTAHRVLQFCKKIFRYAVLTRRAQTNVAAELNDALKSYSLGHYAALDIRELPRLLDRLEQNDARLFLPTRLGLKLLILTFVRTTELIEAEWSEFDFDEAQWIIRAERMKMRRPHLVPLSRQALEILKELKELHGHSRYVFPNRTNPDRTISNNTILSAIGRLGYKGVATGHGFRAMAMTAIKEKLNYRHEVIDRQLAHAPSSKIVAAYDRAEFLSERKKMMQEWADFVDVQAQKKS